MTSQSRIRNLMKNAGVTVAAEEGNNNTICRQLLDVADPHENNITSKYNNDKNIQICQWLQEITPIPILEPFDIEKMDVEISPCFEPKNLFEEVVEDNVLMIEVPSVLNELCLDSANVQSIQPESTNNIDAEFLPLIDSILSDSSIDSDPEYIDNIVEINGGRKRNIVNKKKQMKLLNNTLSNEWTVECPHKDQVKDTVCNIALLSIEEISTFKKNLCSCTSKIEQDKFILTLINVSAPKRTNRKKTERTNRTVTSYFIPAKNGDMVKVCGVAFSSVTSLTRRRLNLVTKTFYNTHSSPVEKRGGYRFNSIATEITKSIV